jgi:hypothetical protein
MLCCAPDYLALRARFEAQKTDLVGILERGEVAPLKGHLVGIPKMAP